MYHQFHIPVMGTGHTIDSPVRVAHLGIDSVVSIVDDLLLERIRKYYSSLFELPFEQISRNAPDGRARRITAYLDMMHEIVQRKFGELKAASFDESSGKNRYFELLPDSSPIREMWAKMRSLAPSEERTWLQTRLSAAMKPGAMDVNIMAKVDHLGWDANNLPLSNEFSDACAALRGFANSVAEASVVLSAGFNPRLYGYISQFPNFYRDTAGRLKKRIILKVSDFRSALIQGKFLAKNGLEVSEFRIESGLNCGGHAFYADGKLLPVILEEFRQKKEELLSQLKPLITAFYEKTGRVYPEAALSELPKITVQGGIGTSGEQTRLIRDFGVDGTGWGSPFLLVPEATCVDDPTVQLLADAREEDLYLSKVSPLGVPFNNLRETGSEKWTRARMDTAKPGSPCPKGFLKTNTEFTEQPICTASTEYQVLKLAQISDFELPDSEKDRLRSDVLAKTCLCDHLGNGSLIKLGVIREQKGPQAICPGPNVAWFNRTYSLDEMVAHIYGRGESLVPEERPHMFAKELDMNVEYLNSLLLISDPADPKAAKYFDGVIANLTEGIEACEKIAGGEPYPGENLESLRMAIVRARHSLEGLAVGA